MISYKGFRPGLICRGYQFVMGLNTTEKANCRENGFHCAEDPLDCLSYYSSLEHSEYYIVNAGGDIEPCAFIHYSDSNIHEKTLIQAYQSPLFMQYHDGQPFNDNMLRPCPMLENPEKLREIVHKSSAHPSDVTALESVDDLCAKCDDYAKNWAPTADKLWSCSHHCGTCGQQAAAEK